MANARPKLRIKFGIAATSDATAIGTATPAKFFITACHAKAIASVARSPGHRAGGGAPGWYGGGANPPPPYGGAPPEIVLEAVHSLRRRVGRSRQAERRQEVDRRRVDPNPADHRHGGPPPGGP